MVDRDKELNDLFATQGLDNAKAVKDAEGRKGKFLNQLIHVIYKDADGLTNGCDWKVQRRKCNMKFLQGLLDRSSQKGVQLDYVYDSSASAMWIDDMMMNAQPIPEQYFIVPKIEKTPFDIVPDPTYDGQVLFLME